MPNKVDISNSALNMVGQQIIIAALTDASVSARLCQLNIDFAIREVLDRGTWKSARKRATLVQTTTPAFEWEYAYILPVDFIRMIAFNDISDGSNYPLPYVVEGRLLLTDEIAVEMVYLSDLASPGNDVSLASPLLTNLFILNLAIKLCWPLQQDRSLRESLQQQFAFSMREAKIIDSRDERKNLPNQYRDSTWLSARASSTDS